MYVDVMRPNCLPAGRGLGTELSTGGGLGMSELSTGGGLGMSELSTGGGPGAADLLPRWPSSPRQLPPGVSPRDQRGVAADIQGMAWRTVRVRADAAPASWRPVGKRPRIDKPSVPEGAPGREHDTDVTRQHFVPAQSVVRTLGIGMPEESLRVWRAQRIEVDDDNPAEAFTASQSAAPSDGGIVGLGARGRRVQHHEDHQRRPAPAASQCVAVGALPEIRAGHRARPRTHRGDAPSRCAHPTIPCWCA